MVYSREHMLYRAILHQNVQRTKTESLESIADNGAKKPVARRSPGCDYQKVDVF